MAHYGAWWDWEHLPGSWSSTENFNEEMQFIFKDALLVLDDFVPKGSASDIQRAHRWADRMYRGAANNAGRGRLDKNIQPRPPRPPRCLLYGTGEDLPHGESLQARIWITDYATGDVDFQKLKTCSKDAAAGLYAEAMAAFLQWYAETGTRLNDSCESEHDSIMTTQLQLVRGNTPRHQRWWRS